MPEHDPNHLHPDAAKEINGLILSSVDSVDTQIGDVGFRKRYEIEFQSLPGEVRSLVRRVVNGVYPHQGETEAHLHPYGHAVERGLIMGLAIALEAFPIEENDQDGIRGAFLGTFTEDLTTLYEAAYLEPRGGRRYDLEELLLLSGASMANFLRTSASKNLLEPFDDPAQNLEERRTNLCINAMGYVLAEAKVILTYEAMQGQQTEDPKAFEEIKADAETVKAIQDDLIAFVAAEDLFPELFPKE